MREPKPVAHKKRSKSTAQKHIVANNADIELPTNRGIYDKSNAVHLIIIQT